MIFRTTDLSFSAFLVNNNVKYLGPEKITDKAFYFTFEDPDRCIQLEKKYLTIKEELLKGISYIK